MNDAPEEAVTSVARQLFLDDPWRSIRRVLFTSVDDSHVSANAVSRIAEVFAQQADGPVYLLDLDLDHPSFDRLFDLVGVRGFSDALMEGGDLRGYAHQASPTSKLWIVPVGLQAPAARAVLDEADGDRRIMSVMGGPDYVIAHAAGIRHFPDAERLGSLFDGVVLVTRASTTTAEATRQAADAVKAAQATLLGTIVDDDA